MLNILINILSSIIEKEVYLNILSNDAPYPWQIAFQDPASPGFVGIFDLHDNIFFYLVLILISVMWVLGAVLFVFKDSSNAISSKYLSHGTGVPIQKCSKLNNKISIHMFIRTYATLYNNTLMPAGHSRNNAVRLKINIIKTDPTDEDAFTMKKDILKENEGKSGIYMLNNKLTNDIYIGLRTRY